MRRWSRGRRPWVGAAAFLLWAAVSAVSGDVAAQSSTERKGASGQPLPRFVSLKADRVNLRTGPGTEYPTVWVYRRAGLPVEVVSEFEGWREVRDAEGTTGWIIQSLLSSRRTALVAPWDAEEGKSAAQIAVRLSDSESSRAVAIVEAGVIANVQTCDSRWCRISIDEFRGYIPQKQLWGVYQDEVIR